MVSDKLRRILYAKGAKLTEEQLAAWTDAEAWKWIYTNFPPESHRPRQPRDNREEICFTGFRDSERAELKSTHSDRFKIVSGVTVNLRYLIIGPEPGPVKIQRAREQKVPILSLEEFRAVLRQPENK